MRNAILFFCLLLSVCACNRHSYPHELLVVDSLCYEMPDSAVAMLQWMETEMTDKDEATRMYYYLLTIKAKDKAYVFHTSDSLMLSVLQYYQKKKDPRHLPEAYYYAGRVYRDLGDAPQALDYFQKAIDAMGENKDYVLLNTIYSQMGYLFLYQDVYEEAMNSFKQSYQCDLILNDSLGMAHSLKDVGHAFTAFHCGDSALYYYDKSYQIAKSFNNRNLMDGILRSKARIYLQLGNYEQTLDIFERMDSLSLNRNSTYALRADYYNHTNQLDSALLYYKYLINDENIYARKDAYWELAKIAQQSKNSVDALRYIAQYEIINDSIVELQNFEQVLKMQSMYNYQLREKEINSLNEKKHKNDIYILLLGIMALIVFLCFLVYTQYLRKRKAEQQVQIEKLKAIQEKQYLQSTMYAEDNKRKIAILEEKIKNAETSNGLEDSLLKIRKERFLSTNISIEVDKREKELLIKSFHKSDIYLKFHMAKEIGDIKTEDWNLLQSEIDKTYNEFTKTLYSLYSISEMELRICLLIKTNISVSNIANLTGRSKSAITSARKKLYEKIHGEKGTPELFDRFIDSLC